MRYAFCICPKSGGAFVNVAIWSVVTYTFLDLGSSENESSIDLGTLNEGWFIYSMDIPSSRPSFLSFLNSDMYFMTRPVP